MKLKSTILLLLVCLTYIVQIKCQKYQTKKHKLNRKDFKEHKKNKMMKKEITTNKITEIVYASYGTATKDSTGAFTNGKCHGSNSITLIK